MEKKIIEVTCCGTCPFVEIFTGGKKYACGYLTLKTVKPYAQDRAVDAATMAEFCPLP